MDLDSMMLLSPQATAHVASVVASVCFDMADEMQHQERVVVPKRRRKHSVTESLKAENDSSSPSPKSSRQDELNGQLESCPKQKKQASPPPPPSPSSSSVASADMEPQELLKRARSRLMEEFLRQESQVLPHLLFKDRYNSDGRIGIYTARERAAILARFKSKKTRRVWDKTIRYNVRKNFADQRMRVKGRFVKHLPNSTKEERSMSLSDAPVTTREERSMSLSEAPVTTMTDLTASATNTSADPTPLVASTPANSNPPTDEAAAVASTMELAAAAAAATGETVEVSDNVHSVTVEEPPSTHVVTSSDPPPAVMRESSPVTKNSEPPAVMNEPSPAFATVSSEPLTNATPPVNAAMTATVNETQTVQESNSNGESKHNQSSSQPNASLLDDAAQELLLLAQGGFAPGAADPPTT